MSKNRTKKNKPQNKKNRRLPREVTNLIFIFFSIFTLLSFLTDSTGKVGDLIRKLFDSLFSQLSFLAAFSIFAVSVSKMIPRLKGVRFLKYRLYHVFFAGIFIIYANIKSGGYPKVIPISIEAARLACKGGQAGTGPGLIGEIPVYFAGNYIGWAGNMLLGILLLASSCIYGFNISVSQNAKFISRHMKKLFEGLKKPKNLKKSKRKRQSEKEESKKDIEIIGFNQQENIEKEKIAGLEKKGKQHKVDNIETTLEKIGKSNGLKEEMIVSTQTQSDEKFEGYRIPPVELMKKSPKGDTGEDKTIIMQNIASLEKTLKDFGVDAKVSQVSVGPSITRYELQPRSGVKVSKIVNLSDDIALNLAAPSIRIEAPIPGKSAVGIEVPNKNVEMVTFGDIIESSEFKESSSKLSFALGKDISGMNIVSDISKMPHMLIAGATGSGKSVCVNSLIMSILYKARPDEVKFIMIDPKVVELSNYNDIPHLLIPVVTDPQKAAMALNWAVNEMTKRYKTFAENSVKDIESYNRKSEEKMPKIVVIIDELADLMISSPKEVEDSICRLAQMARAAGMHIVIATQRPSVDVITGVIKANIPSRIAFSVSSQTDSRTILDMGGAEKLLGKGDMLFYPVGQNKPRRIQGAFISEEEIQSAVDYVKNQDFKTENKDEDIIQEIENIEYKKDSAEDELMEKAVDFVISSKQASASMLQRKFRIGFNRAARIIDDMEDRGIIGPSEGSKPRKVLLSKETI